MSNRSPSDLCCSLCSGFPEGEVISAETFRCENGAEEDLFVHALFC